MYRFGVTKKGFPKVEWKVKYRNTRKTKPGQADDGTGTTPTILKGGYIAITDNADPMNVVVYRTGLKLHGKKRVVCEVPVFKKGASATENSIIGTGRSLIVENNYGYEDIFGPTAATNVTEPGFSPHRRQEERQGLQEDLDEHGGAGPHGRAEALDEDRPDLHLHPAAGPERSPGLLLDRDRLQDGQDRLDQVRRIGLLLQQQLLGHGPRPGRHRLPRSHRRPGLAARPVVGLGNFVR